MSDDCLLAGGEFHPFFVLYIAITAFGGGGDDLDELELCLDLLVDFLDRELFKHRFAHLQLEQSLLAAWQSHALFAQVDLNEQVQHESPYFCVVGGTLIPSPFGLEKSRIDWFNCFTIRPFLRTTGTNWGSVEAETFFSGVLFVFCLFFCRVGVDGRMHEVTTEAAAEVAAPAATIRACSLLASFWRQISRLIFLLLSVSLTVSWLLLSRECIFPAFAGLTKSTGSFRPPEPMGMID